MRKKNCFARTNGEAKCIFCKNEKGEAKYWWKVRSSGLKIGFSFVDRRRKIIIHLLFFVSWFVISRCLTNTSIWKQGNKDNTGWLIDQRISKILMHKKAHFKLFRWRADIYRSSKLSKLILMIAYRRFIRIKNFEAKMAKSLLSKKISLKFKVSSSE